MRKAGLTIRAGCGIIPPVNSKLKVRTPEDEAALDEWEQQMRERTAKMKVPLDEHKVAQLSTAFSELSTKKQTWLLQRFPHCDTDAEASKLLNIDVKAPVDWKRDDAQFALCYNLLKSGLIDWERHLAQSLESGNALLAAMENRKLLLKSWDTLNAREASAKSATINQTLARVLGQKEGIDINVINVADVLPE